MKDPNRRPIFEPAVLPSQTVTSLNPNARTPLESLLMRALRTKDVAVLERFLATLRGKAVILERDDYEAQNREIRRLVGSL